MWSVARRDVGGEGAQGVEGRLVADLELTVYVLLDQVYRHVARAVDHHLDVALPPDGGELAERVELRELRLVVASALQPGRRPSPSEKATSYKVRCMISLTCSGSSRSDKAVKPETSAKSTLTCLRSQRGRSGLPHAPQ
jgi:hypothetical protein